MSDLKPCPFCGGEAYVAKRAIHGILWWYGCGCKKCRVQYGCLCDTEEEAIEQWNRRVSE